MKNLKNLMAAVTLLAVLIVGTGSANAGVVGDSVNPSEDPCKETIKFDSGIIVVGIVGIIVVGRTGIIVVGKDSDNAEVNCGIIVVG